MKTFLSTRLGKIISLSLLFLVASFFVYYGWMIFVPIVPHYGRMFATYFPTFFTCGVPLISFFMLWMYWHAKNIKSKWQIQRVYALILLILMAICIPFHILSISSSFGWAPLYGMLSPLFPYDQLVLMVLYLGLAIYLYIYNTQHKEYKKVEKTIANPLRRRAYVASAFAFAFTAYFTCVNIHVFNIIDWWDPNWYGMVPMILSHFLPLVALILFVIYKHIDPTRQRKFYRNSIIALLSCFVGLLAWFFIALSFNFYFVSESMSSFYPLGYAAKMPGGFMVVCIMIFVELLVSFIRYRKIYHPHAKQK